MNDSPIGEVVGLFHSEKAMEEALSSLHSMGIKPDHIELLASCETIEAKLGHRFKSVSEFEDKPNIPRMAYIPSGDEKQFQHTLIGALTYVATGFGLILASSTGLAQMLIAATAAGGAVASVGEALNWLVGHKHAHELMEQLKCGGLLIWVRVNSEAQAQTIISVLKKYGGEDVHFRLSEPLPESDGRPKR